MKKFLRKPGLFSIALIFILLVASSAQAQRTASVSGNWSSTATWGGQAVPTSADAVTINSGITVTVDINANCASLSFLAAATANSTVNINTGVSLTVVGNVTIPRQGTNNNTMGVGPGTLNAANILFTSGGNGQRHFLTITTGTVNVTGNLDATSSTGSATIQFNTPGTGTINLGGGFLTGGTGTFTHGDNASTVNFNGSAAQSIPNTTYNFNNIRTNNAAGVTLAGNATATNLTGNLSVQSGIFNNGGFSITLAAGRNYSVSSGATFNLTGTSTGVAVSGGGTKTFGTTSTVNYGGTNQTVTAETFGNLTLSGSGNKTFAGTTTIASALSISGTAVALLANGTTSTANTLLLGGAGQTNGSWGGTGSAAAHKNATFFGATTTGVVNVAQQACTPPTINGTLSLCGGQTTQLTSPDAPAASNPWVSANTSVATISNTGLVTAVSAGTSVITFTNSTGCSNTATITVNATPATSFTKNDVQCFNTNTGQIIVVASGGTGPYTYSIDNGANYLNNGGTFNGLGVGTYKIRVKDANQCQSKSVQ